SRAGSSTVRGRARSQVARASRGGELKVGQPAQIEPASPGALDETDQHAVAVGAAHDQAGRLRVEMSAAERPGVTATDALAGSRGDIDGEHVAQRAGGSV